MRDYKSTVQLEATITGIRATSEIDAKWKVAEVFNEASNSKQWKNFKFEVMKITATEI